MRVLSSKNKTDVHCSVVFVLFSGSKSGSRASAIESPVPAVNLTCHRTRLRRENVFFQRG